MIANGSTWISTGSVTVEPAPVSVTVDWCRPAASAVVSMLTRSVAGVTPAVGDRRIHDAGVVAVQD